MKRGSTVLKNSSYCSYLIACLVGEYNADTAIDPDLSLIQIVVACICARCSLKNSCLIELSIITAEAPLAVPAG